MRTALSHLPCHLTGQGLPAFNYELGVRMGTQDSADVVTEVGVAFWKGFSFADMLFYIPLLGYALATYDDVTQKNKTYLAAALGITVSWPIVCLKAAISARGAPGWSLDDRPFLILLPVIILWAAWQMACLERKNEKDLSKNFIGEKRN